VKIILQATLNQYQRILFGSMALIVTPFFLSMTPAQAQVSIPDCSALGQWALKMDRNAMWQPNSIGSNTKIPSLFASDATTALFKKPMIAWTEAEGKAIRDAVLACRKGTKDKAESSAYNSIQSAIISRVTNYANALAQGRSKISSAMTALKGQPASLSLLRFQAALAEAVTLDGFNQAQRAASGLQGAAATAGRDLLAGMRELPQAEIVETVAKPAAVAAQAMRAQVAQGLIADVKKIAATGPGLTAIDQMIQALPRDYGPALGPESLKSVQQALAERRAGVTEEIATALVTQIGQSSQSLESAFTDIDQRANEAFLSRLSPGQAAKVRDAATARRQTVSEIMLKEFQKGLVALPTNETSLKQVDMSLGVFNAWPVSAAAFKPRFQEASQARRAEILAVVNRAESGSLQGRIYEAASGMLKLEFVDRNRVFASQSGGQATAGTYTEEKDGRVVVTLNQQSSVWSREGRQLKGGSDVVLSRTK
jgi:hypothetical protein